MKGTVKGAVVAVVWHGQEWFNVHACHERTCGLGTTQDCVGLGASAWKPTHP